MPVISLQCYIQAKQQLVFDLSRNIDLHKISTAHTKEQAIAGVTSGLISLNESVTWRANHFGFSLKMTSKITEMQSPIYFRDEQVEGPFKYLQHDHYFEEKDEGVIMKDEFSFGSPLGIAGKFIDWLVMKKYLENLLKGRNETIKEFAESDKWRTVLGSAY